MISAKSLRARYAKHSKSYDVFCDKIIAAAKEGLTRVTIVLHDIHLNTVDIKELKVLGYRILISSHSIYSNTSNALDYEVAW